MAKKKNDSATSVALKIAVPTFKSHVTPANPVTGQWEKFEPFKLALDKRGEGTIGLIHKQRGIINYENEIEVVFVNLPSATSSSKAIKEPGSSKDTQVEFSYSTRGYAWSSRLRRGYPYSESKHGKMNNVNLDGAKNRLKREAYLIVRDPKDDSAFNLGLFSSVLKNVDALKDIQGRVHAEASAKHGVAGNGVVVKIGIHKETDGDFEVIRWDKKYEIVDVLDGESLNAVDNLRLSIDDFLEKRIDRFEKRCKKSWADYQEAEALAIAIEEAKAKAVAQVAAQSAPSGLVTPSQEAADPIEEIPAADLDMSDPDMDPTDDGDLPF